MLEFDFKKLVFRNNFISVFLNFYDLLFLLLFIQNFHSFLKMFVYRSKANNPQIDRNHRKISFCYIYKRMFYGYKVTFSEKIGLFVSTKKRTCSIKTRYLINYPSFNICTKHQIFGSSLGHNREVFCELCKLIISHYRAHAI